MQFRKTIIVTLVAALTLVFAPKAKAEVSLIDLMCAGIGAGVGGVIGNQIGGGSGKTIATAALAAVGALGGYALCDHAQREQYAHPIASSCGHQCSSGGSTTNDIRLSHVGYWEKDLSQQCRCFDVYGNDVGSQPVGSAGTVYCTMVQKQGYKWIPTGKLVHPSEVISAEEMARRARVDKAIAAYEEELRRTNQATASSLVDQYGSLHVRLPNGKMCVRPMPADFFNFRNAYLNDDCKPFLDRDPVIPLADGTSAARAYYTCMKNNAEDELITGKRQACYAIIFDHQVLTY